MNILKAVEDDVQTILDIQKVAYISEAEAYNNYQIAPLRKRLISRERIFRRKPS